LTLLALAYYGDVVTISIGELGSMTLLSERAVRMAIGELVSLGELAVEFNVGGNSRYRLLMPEREPEPLPWAPKYPDVPPVIRLRIFDRDGWRCVSCGSSEDLTIDHIRPRARGGTNEESNLQTLCRPCNCRKGARV
jgi:HNH endonuclease